MALKSWVVALVASGGLLLAPPGASAEVQPAGEAESQLVPPKPIGSIEVPYPEDAPPLTDAVEVEVVLQIDDTGAVADVQIVRSAGQPWDDAVLAAAKAFVFEPARWNGEPAAVEIPFVQRFAPAADAQVGEAEAKLDAAVEGEILEMGTRRKVPAGIVVAQVDGRRYRAEADAEGRFTLRVPSGAARIEVEIPGYKRFLVHEQVEAGEALRVRYLVERISYNPFEQLVIGRATRQEVTRTTLRDREIRRVPGTFGDPFRVVGTMPGVGQMFSLLDYPIVRGASPGSTGILLDGDRIPQLFHFLAGPAVIHPEFLDRVDFYPGAFPIEYGGYTGGIVDGVTRSALPEERRIELGVDLLNSSLFVRQPIFGATGTIAGRYGYPAMLLSAFSEGAFASYWDYQARLDGRAGDGRWTVFFFGSFDEFGEATGNDERVTAASLFHRVKLRWIEGDDASFDRYELGVGFDEMLSGAAFGEEEEDDPFDPTGGGGPLDASNSNSSWVVHPRASWRRPLTKTLAVHGGIDFSWRRNQSVLRVESEEGDIVPPNWLVQAGAFVETPWWLGEDFLLTPGIRSDIWETDDTRRYSLDPRLNARLRVRKTESEQVWLKSGIGIFHQPPRPPVSLPGAGELLLREGLPAAVQTSAGTEVDFASGYLVDVQTYFNYMDPIFFDLEVNGSSAEQGFEANQTHTGRSYGVELLLRKRDRGDFFGWISYTLSRSERQTAEGWKPFDFDRSHMLQLVAGLRLPRDWELGARFQAISGRPVNQWDEGLERAAPFTRFDLRIDKRAVYRDWMLDFYVELINAMIAREQVAEGADASIPYIFPTVGFRAVL